MLEILDSLILKNAVVSVDAINTQKKIVTKYHFFWQEAEAYLHKLERDTPSLIECYEETVCERGRIDHRDYHRVNVTDWLSESAQWSGVKSVLRVSRTRENKHSGKQPQDVAFYISSLEADVQ